MFWFWNKTLAFLAPPAIVLEIRAIPDKTKIQKKENTMSVKYNDKNVNIATETIKGLLRGGIHVGELASALNNAFCHGDIFNETDQLIDDDDILMGELFAGIEKFSDAAKRIVNYDGGDVGKK